MTCPGTYGIAPYHFWVRRCHHWNMSSATNLQFLFDSSDSSYVNSQPLFLLKPQQDIYPGFLVPTSAVLTLTGGITVLIYPIVAGLILSSQQMYFSAMHRLLISYRTSIQYVNLFNNSSLLGIGNTLVKRSAKLVSVSFLDIRVAPLSMDSLIMW